MRTFKRVLFLILVILVLAFLGQMTNHGLRSATSRNISTITTSLDHQSQISPIPKRIHQIWNDEIVPVEFAENVKSLVRDNKHPEWEYYFWTKESGLKFLKEKYPLVHKRILAGADDTMRADILRYAIIHEYGGVYFDLDTVSVQPLNGFVATHECSLSKEPGEHLFVQYSDLLVTNSALLCKAGHTFYKHLLVQVSNLSPNCTKAFKCTGPFIVTRLYREINHTKGHIFEIPDLLPSKIFQDTYDVLVSTKTVYAKCKDLSKLKPYQVEICNNWSIRGKEKRSLSASALTFHTWFHVYGRKLNILKENNISNIVPHVKIYGRNF